MWFIQRLRAFVDHAVTQITVAAGLLMTSLWEVGEELYADITSLSFEGEHGIIIFALFHMMHHLGHLFEVTEKKEQ